MKTKLEEAIESGKQERAKLLEATSKPNPKWIIEQQELLRKKRQVCRKWIKEKFFALVSDSVMRGKNEIRLGYAGEHVDVNVDMFLVEALNDVSGVNAVLRKDNVNMQDSSAPCWETVYWIDVTWKNP